MVRLKLIVFALVGTCLCQYPVVHSSGQTRTSVSNQIKPTTYSSYQAKPNNWPQYGSTQTWNKYNSVNDKKTWGNLYSRNVQSNSYSRNVQSNSYSHNVQSKSYSRNVQSNSLKTNKGYTKSQTKYKKEKLKTKPSHYRLRSVGRSLVEQYIQQFMPWETCKALIGNFVDDVFNPTSIFATTFVDEGIDNLCGNTLFAMVEPLFEPFTDKLFEAIHLSRDQE